jgi:P-type E1-E2 ATPase
LGLLVRDPVALERAASARHVVFDLTGTLSAARPALEALAVAPGWTEDQALALAAAVEGAALHPCALAVRNAAEARGLTLPTVSERVELPGVGVRARQDGKELFVGRPRVERSTSTLAGELQTARERFEAKGASVAELMVDGVTVAVMAFAAPLRADAQAVVGRLARRGLVPHLLSGNHERAVAAVAQSTAIADARSQMTPESKLAALRVLETSGGALMVGDGINDGPALAGASVGLAVHGAADVASAAGTVVLLRPELTLVVTLVDLARSARRVIRQNLLLAFAYNLAALPAAMGLLAFELPPAFAALFMSLSCIALMLNASRLLRWVPRED